MTRTTKLVLAVIILGILVLVIFAISNYSAEDPDPENRPGASFLFPSGADDVGSGNGAIPPIAGDPKLIAAAEAKLKQMTREAVAGAAFSKSGDKLLYYKRSGGNLFQIDTEGKAEERLGQMTILGLTEVRWSPTRENSLLAYLQSGSIKRLIHQLSTSTTSLLPNGITSAEWSPDGKLAAYTEARSDGLRVVTVTPSAKSPKVVLTSSIPDWRVQWKTPNALILTTAPTFLVEGISEILSLNGARQTFIQKRGLGILPTGTKDLVAASHVSEAGAFEALEIINGKGAVVATSDARTAAEKCSWNKTATTLYCAVPRGNITILPDSWYRGEVSFRDRLVKIDVATGKTEPLADTELDAIELFLDPTETNLYFINKGDGTLWKFKLN